jgi:glycine betaine catabolism A
VLDPNVLSPNLTKNLGFSTATVPSNLYYSAEQFELERERIFRRAWLKVGRIEQIPKSGDFFVKEIDLFSASIILSRARDGSIHALHNVCSHRGNQVVHEREGNRSKFTCRYHSWTFQNTGELVGVPDERSFFGLDKKKCGLSPVAVDVWEGWIFINFQSKPEVSLKEFLGPFGEAFSGVAYPNPENSVVLKGEFQANWKTVADAFSEAYHLSSIHPKTFGPLYAGKSNPFSRPLSAEIYGPHRSMSTWLDTTFQMPDSARVERWVSPPGETVTGTRKPGQRNALIDHPAINPSKSDAWASDAKWVFPNWHIQISANMFWTHEFWPISATRTKWEGRFFVPKPRTARERIALEYFTAKMSDGMLEDLSNIESTQRGMMSGAKPFLILQDGELLIRHSLEQVVKWTTSLTAAEALDLNPRYDKGPLADLSPSAANSDTV